MSKKDEKHESELSMEDLEQVAGGTATPVAPTPQPPPAGAKTLLKGTSKTIGD